ncbi:MAG TPA: sugar phosphate isomerase/epimerase, partial [Planctomycetaceae bacterium]|nr:sugar phosphate isomerase/epimerase [Planctomycetaceae bacterium]
LDFEKPTEIDHLVAVLKRVMPLAEKQGLTIALENYLSAKDNLRIIDRVASPVLKVYYDVGNSTDKNYDIYAEIQELGKRNLIVQFHAKDGRSPLGQGRIDFKRLRRVLDAIDYRGWIVLESVHPGGVVESYRKQAACLRSIFPC